MSVLQALALGTHISIEHHKVEIFYLVLRTSKHSEMRTSKTRPHPLPQVATVPFHCMHARKHPKVVFPGRKALCLC